MIATAVYLVAGAALHHRLPALRPALQENICLHRRAAAPRCAADVQTQIQAALDADKTGFITSDEFGKFMKLGTPTSRSLYR